LFSYIYIIGIVVVSVVVRSVAAGECFKDGALSWRLVAERGIAEDTPHVSRLVDEMTPIFAKANWDP
jgi:hypothetical protein